METRSVGRNVTTLKKQREPDSYRYTGESGYRGLTLYWGFTY